MSGLPGLRVVPYYTGTGYEADHLIPGAKAQAEVIARKLGYSGKLLFVTCAGDDDWTSEYHTHMHHIHSTGAPTPACAG